MGQWMMLPFLGLGLALLAFPVLVLGLLAATITLWSRVRRLEARLRTLEGTGGLGEPARPGGVSEPAPPGRLGPPAADVAAAEVFAASSAVVTTAPAAAPVGATEPAVPLPRETSVGGPTLDPVPAPGIAAAPGSSAVGRPGGIGALEGRVGGTWLNRVGALALVLGIGLFLRHAFENDWIGPWGRVGLGVAVGLAFVLSASRHLGGRYRGPAQGAAAVGLAALYLSAYAAHGVYGLVTAAPAFTALALVSGLTLALAVRHDALALALLAGAGGLLTPALLDSGVDRGELLFAYLAILDLGLLVAAQWRGWATLRLLAFAGTAVLYGSWLDAWFRPARLALGLGAATGLYLLFGVASYVGTPRQDDAGRLGRGFTATALVVLGAPTLYFLATRRLLTAEPRSTLAILCLVMALVYAGAGQAALRLRRSSRPLAALCLTLALVFLSLALAIRLNRHALVVGWSVEALLLFFAGHRLELRRLRAGACFVFLAAWIRWYTLLADGGLPGPFLASHPALPATIAVALTAALGAAICRLRERAGRPLVGWERLAAPGLVLVSVGSVAMLLTDELGRFRTLAIPPPYVPTVTAVVWMVAALPALALARFDSTRILLSAATLALIALGVTTIGDAPRWERLLPEMRPLVLNARFLAGLLLAVLYWLYAKVVPELPGLEATTRVRLGAAASLAAGLLLLWNLSTEVLLAPLPALGTADAAKARRAGLSILWALYAFGAMGIGLRTGRRLLRLLGIGLFGVTVVKVLVIDMGDLDAVYRILSLVVLGGVLLLASFLYTRSRRETDAAAVANPGAVAPPPDSKGDPPPRPGL